MKNENRRYSMLINYGVDGARTLKEIELLARKGALPDNMSEVFRRGIHCCKILAQVDERLPLKSVSDHLRSLGENADAQDIDFIARAANDISHIVLSIMIVKSGIQQADLFKRLADRIAELSARLIDLLNEHYKNEGMGNKLTIPRDIIHEAETIASAIATVFLDRGYTKH